MKKFFIILTVFLLIFTVSCENRSLQEVTGAVGGGKENFLADSEYNKLLNESFGLSNEAVSWSNGKLVKEDVVTPEGDSFDYIFFSDQRFFDYYKQPANTEKGEAKRYTVKKGGMILNTPIVIYTWDNIAQKLIEKGLVEIKDGVYYLTGFDRLINMILDKTNWKDLDLPEIDGNINILSTDPVVSSPGATWYGLLVSALNGGSVSEDNLEDVLPRLADYYERSGYLNNSPADLFDLFLREGYISKPMIADYEKSIIDFANNVPYGWESVKDKVRILYPVPTIWNSHCIAALTDNGVKYMESFENKEVQDIAWKKYGFRTGLTGGAYNVKDCMVAGLPGELTSVVPALKINMYDRIVEYLKNKSNN